MELISKELLSDAINNIKLEDVRGNFMTLYRIVLRCLEETPSITASECEEKEILDKILRL